MNIKHLIEKNKDDIINEYQEGLYEEYFGFIVAPKDMTDRSIDGIVYETREKAEAAAKELDGIVVKVRK